MKSSTLIFAFLSTLILSLAFVVFYIFRPYTYVDNATSRVICDKNGSAYEIGWNFIYTFDDKLDSWNDAKARKICEYNIVKDYANTVQTPKEVNYRFEPKYIQESSWSDAVFMFFATLIFGAVVIEFANNTLRLGKSSSTHPEGGFQEDSDRIWNKAFIFISIIFAIILFFFFFKKPAAMIFCKRQIARKVNNFKRVVFKYGVVPIPEDDKHINSLLKPLYEKCIQSEGI